MSTAVEYCRERYCSCRTVPFSTKYEEREGEGGRVGAYNNVGLQRERILYLIVATVAPVPGTVLSVD